MRLFYRFFIHTGVFHGFFTEELFLLLASILPQALNLSERLIDRMYLFQLYLCSLCDFWPESTLYSTGIFFFSFFSLFFDTSRKRYACPVPVVPQERKKNQWFLDCFQILLCSKEMSDSKEWKWDNFCLQAEKASLVHFLDFLSLIFLTMIWAICPRDSLAVVGQWIQSKLQEVRLTFSIVLPDFLGKIFLIFCYTK